MNHKVRADRRVGAAYHVMALVAFAPAGYGIAQPCSPGFQPGQPGAGGINDTFSAYVGPMTSFQNKLILGGSFSSAGNIAMNALASFDPLNNTWARLGGGIDLGNTNGFVAGLTTFAIAGTPSLIVGGSFNGVRNGTTLVPESRALAAWNGTTWSNLGTGFSQSNFGSVWTVMPWPQPNGTVRLLAGGGWNTIGTATADGVAYYDGVAWQNVGGPSDLGIQGGSSVTVFASAIYNNDLFIGGRFTGVNSVTSPLVARWSGTAWVRPGTTLTAGGVFSDVSAMHVWNDGSGAKLYVAGADIRAGGLASTAAVWNGSTWTRVGQNLGGRGTALTTFNDGTGERLYMGMTADAQQQYIYRLEGAASPQWVAVDGGVSGVITSTFPSVFGLLSWNNSLYVGGNFLLAGGEPSQGIARYAGCGPTCNDIDFNNDGLQQDPTDLEAFFSVYSGGPCLPAGALCDGLDFNNDGLEQDPTDLEAFFSVYSGGPCL